MSTLSKITSACVVLLLCMLCVPSQAQAADAKGERVADALKKAKSLYAPDGRTAVWDLEWDESSQSIKGKVSHESLLAQLKDEMGRSGLGSLKYSVKVLEKRDDGFTVRFSVKDTGIGIPKDEQERIFERFYRVDKSHSREVGGTGLGLSIVKHAVNADGGSIKVESAPGEGTVISVCYPLEK